MNAADVAGRRVRLFVHADLAAAATVDLDAAQTHYLRHVMRRSAGDAVALFNGRDGEWRATIAAYAKSGARLSVTVQARPQRPEPDLWLVFAPIKRAHLDVLAEKATELGVSALVPVFTRHTAVGRINIERLRANAVEAAEQCERLSVPQLVEPVHLDRCIAGWPSERRLLLCAEAGEARPIATALAELARRPEEMHAPWAVLIGPEGGFARSELDGLRKLPFVTPVGLGPRVLRADTAALAALACWQAILGDGEARPPPRA